MKRRYKLYNEVGMFLGEITKGQVIKGLEYDIIALSELGERYWCRCFSIEHFNQVFKECKKEEQKEKFKCWDCGTDIKSTVKYKRVYCNSCNEKRIEQEKIDLYNYTVLRKKLMLERAIKILENQDNKINIFNYKDAIETIEEYIKENPNQFDSSHEITTAIELIRKEIKIKVQPVIEGMRFDFMIRDDKVVLEIDGHLHQYKVQEDAVKDLKVREILGEDWEVIRIPTKYIEQNISALYRAIKKMYEYKQEIRVSNNGVLPDYYSEREKTIWVID